jgi:hypothetical protein
MAVLADYNYFLGRHWETGSVSNHYAYQGVKAPHTNQPYSEALLMGVSGGIVMAYFSFAYECYDPQARVLTRNTFDPLDTLLERLGVVQDRVHTPDPAKAERKLLECLDSGVAPIVWADMFSLPYNNLPDADKMWGMFPLVVYGYDLDADRAWIADRARVPLNTTVTELRHSRGRVKNVKHRLLTLAPPAPEKLPTAVRKGIWDCIKLFTEAPPKGSRNNFGLAAFRWWAELLTKPKARMSWEREFPAGPKLYSGLVWAFNDIMTFGKDGYAERDLYADFLEEAALVLEKGALREVAGMYRRSAKAWEALAQALLPDEAPLLGETRRLILERHRLFLDRGSDALEDLRALDARLEVLKQQAANEFPLDAAGVAALRERICQHVLELHDIEKEAVEALQAAIS